MQLEIFKDYTELSSYIAGEIIRLVKENPKAVLCLASGDSPRLTCEMTAKRAISEKIDFSQITFFGLDEWVGVPPANEGSCRYFFDTLLIKPLQLKPSQVHLFDALSEDLEKDCRNMDQWIFDSGGIDLMIVGVGMNGHIGFNEPGVSFDNYSHVINLDQTTVTVGQKYFKEPVPLKQGITIGFKHLLQSKKLFMIANGEKKAPIIKQALQADINNVFPATIVRNHRNGYVLIDEAAASLVK